MPISNASTARFAALNAYLFRSLAHVQHLMDKWMLDYNTQRLHQALNFITPIEFKQAA
jgi:putative transposase